VIVRGALIAGLTTHAEAQEEDGDSVPDEPGVDENGDRVRVRRVER
jgi:hypothetical protein